jgi:hypothetical protein
MSRRSIETPSDASKDSARFVKAPAMSVQQISVLRIKEAERNAHPFEEADQADPEQHRSVWVDVA